MDAQRDVPMLASFLDPAAIGRPGRIAEDQPALFLGQAPKIGNGKKGAQASPAQASPVRRREPCDSSPCGGARGRRSEKHTSELQSLMHISYAVFCLKKKQ